MVNAVGYTAAALDDTADRYANVARTALDAITTYADDVRAGRQVRGKRAGRAERGASDGRAGPAEQGCQAKADPPEEHVATAVIDGITTRYDVLGSGPPLLMMSPGGFDATIEKWRTQGVYTRLKLLDHLPAQYTCIVYRPPRKRRVGRPRRAHHLAALRRAGERAARPSENRTRAHHGRLHGVLAGDGVRRRASGARPRASCSTGPSAARTIASTVTRVSRSISPMCSSTGFMASSRW